MIENREKFKELDEIIEHVKFGGQKIHFILLKERRSTFTDQGILYLTLKSNIISLGQMTEEGSIVELAGTFLRMFYRNGALLMKVKRSHNRQYKILLETS